MSFCIKTKKSSGEIIRQFLTERNLLSTIYKIKVELDSLIIPITRDLTNEEIDELKDTGMNFEITRDDSLELTKKSPSSHVEILEKILLEDELEFIPRSFDTIGDIVVVEIPDKLWEKKTVVGQSLLDAHSSIKSVYVKLGKVSGVNRIRPVEYLVGEKKTRAIYKEHGCRFMVDIEKAYFSPRLSEEHKRIASKVKAKETIADLFCGIGPFVIPIAKEVESEIYALDINSNAIELLKENITLNKLKGKIIPLCGDCRLVIKEQKLEGIADRAIMNLPGYAINFIDVACSVLKPSGGIIHFFEFVRGKNPEETIVEDLKKEISKNNRKVKKILEVKKVRMSAPRQWQMVVDAFIE